MKYFYKIIALSLALSALTATQSVMAAEGDPHWYVGVNYATFNATNVANSRVDLETSGAQIRLGYDFNNWFGLESSIARSQTSNTKNNLTYKVGYLGYFGPRVTLRLENFVLYGTAGSIISSDKACDDSTGSSVCTTKEGVNGAAGFGIDMFGSDNTALNLSVMYYGAEQADNNYSLSLGITWYFDSPKYAPRY